MSARMLVPVQRSRAVYVSGPMRGHPELNFPAFNDAEDRFVMAGWFVCNPVTIGRMAFGPNPDAVTPQDFLREDLRVLLDCGAIAVLPGWEASVGARAEVAVAVALGFAFYDAETMEAIDAPDAVTCNGYKVPA